jgi:hypothetical protein
VTKRQKNEFNTVRPVLADSQKTSNTGAKLIESKEQIEVLYRKMKTKTTAIKA